MLPLSGLNGSAACHNEKQVPVENLHELKKRTTCTFIVAMLDVIQEFSPSLAVLRE